MTPRPTLLHVAILALVASLASPGPRASDERDAARCAAIDAADARLACYDGIFRRPAATPAERSAREIEEFGDRPALRRERGEGLPGESGVARIEARATAVRARPDGTWQITLDNGQVWATTESSSSLQPQVGSAITIRRAALGSFLLRVDGTGAVRARRVR